MKRTTAFLLVALFATAAFAQYWSPIGYAVFTPTTATALSDTPDSGEALPTLAQHAMICVETQPIRWLDDGTAPTASLGHKLSAGQCLVIEKSRRILTNFKMIDTSAGASSVTVTYYQ